MAIRAIDDFVALANDDIKKIKEQSIKLESINKFLFIKNI